MAIAASLACGSAWVGSAWTGSAWAAEPNANASLIYYDMAGNETLDPAEPQNNSSYSHEALLAIFDTLIRLDSAGNPVPGLAESWTRNDDLTELPLMTRSNIYAYKPGCIQGLPPYLAIGDDRFNDVRIAAKCK